MAEGFSAEEYDDEVFEVWEECWDAVIFFRSRIGTRWLYGMHGSPTGVRWEAVYPLLDRHCMQDGFIDNDKWDLLLFDLEAIEIGALESCKPKSSV